MRAAFTSQLLQNYPHFEILFGVSDPSDPAAAEVRELLAQNPDAAGRLIITDAEHPAQNRKVANLIELGQHARYPIWVVNDSDIKVTSDYLRSVVAPLADPAIGLVTCLYRPRPHSVAAAWEALGIATDFMPSTLVAPLVGVREFGLGSTLAFRAPDLARVGGFEPLADFLADDYQLGRRITSLGRRAVLSSYIVETSLGDTTWAGIWRHQIRWSRTVRRSAGPSFYGVFITHAGLWSALALALHAYPVAAILTAVRIASALLTGALILRSPVALLLCWLAPLWDIYAFCIWIAALSGHSIRWRGQNFILGSDGRLRNQ